MPGIPGMSYVTQAKDYFWMEEGDYHRKYHENLGGAPVCQSETANASCDGRDVTNAPHYWGNSPFSNAMDRVCAFTKARDFFALDQAAYHGRYHVMGEDEVTGEQQVSCKKTWRYVSCEGKVLTMGSVYSRNTPFLNALDRFNGSMEEWGKTPGLGFVTGLGRWVFSVLEIGVGVLGVLVGYVHMLAFKCFYKDTTSVVEIFGALFEAGRDQFWLGMKETLSFGCYAKIEGNATLNAMVIKVKDCLPEWVSPCCFE